MKKWIDHLDKVCTDWMREHGLNFLRYSLGIVFIWFGMLKPLGLSPAHDLIVETVFWFSPTWFIPFLGWWEVIIGVCFLYKPLIRLGLILLAGQMIGTFSPLFVLPEVVFGKPFYALSLEGQYIIKNLVIIAAAIVIGSHVRDKEKKLKN